MSPATDSAIVLVALRLLEEEKKKLTTLKPAEVTAVGRKARELVGLLTSVPKANWEAR
jgi:hypothetical protein